MRNKLGKRLFSMLLSTMMVFNMAPVNLTAYAAAGNTPAHAKTLTDNEDGTYTLSLDVTGESERKANPVNVIVILDHSGSMDQRTGGSGSQTRMAAATNAVNNLARSLFSHNTSEFPNMVQMALVGFSTTGSVTQSPTNSYNTFSGAVSRLDADGGTNWEDALQDAAGISFGDSDPTYVIFVSDGNPTFRNTRGNYNPMDNYYYNRYRVYGNGSDSQAVDGISPATTIARCYEHAVDDATSLATSVGADHFYTIGAYGSVDRMRSLTTDAGAPAANYFSAANTTDLQNALNAILAEIEKAGIGSVEIEDGTTNRVTASTGVVKLLEVDTSSFKYYRDGVEWTSDPTPPQAQFVNGAVEWDLSEVGVLDDGVKYTVTFDCYPSQYTYDTIAKLKNGDVKYADLDPEIQKYIVNNGNNSYSLRTNTKATLDWDDTRTDADEEAVDYVNPEPVKTDASTMTAVKEWEGEEADVDSLEMTILMDDKPFHTSEMTKAKGWTTSSFISYGLIKNGKVLPGAEGHDFKFAELDDTQYHWELETPTVHPMIIDGTPTMLVMVDKDHPASGQTYTINNKTYYVDSTVAGLTAINHRRSNLNLTKTVTGEDAPEDATFPFTLTVNNSKAPATAPADDDDHNSDYWVWFSIYDTKAGATVTNATVSGATGPNASGYYYAPSGTAISVEMKDGWNLRFMNLPSGTTYTFEEGILAEGFVFTKAELTAGTDSTFSGNKKTTGTIQSTKTSYAVKYTNDYALTDLEITKVWDDNNNQDGIRPTAEEFVECLTLAPAVEDKTPTVVVDENDPNKYTITYTGLPRYNNGEEVEYTVTESAIDGYTTTGSPAKDHGTITNKHEPEVTSVTVKKVWNDSNDIGKIRPTSINVQLKADDAASGDPVALNADNEWTYTWKNLAKYKEGKAIDYTADETAAPAGYDKTVEKTTAEDGTITFTVTNTYNPTPVSVDPPVQKVITGKDNLYNGGDFTFTIEAVSPTDAPMPENTSITNSAVYELDDREGYYEFGPIKFTKPGTYEYKVTESGSVDGVTNDPDGAKGKTLTFAVTDDGTGKLTVNPTTDQVQLSFTNVYDADGEASIVVTKELSGAAWPEGKTLTLTIDGANGAPMPEETTAKLTAAGSVTFGPIEYALKDAGKTYTYTITEDSFGAGWSGAPESVTAKVEVTDNGDGTLGTKVTYSPENAKFTNTYKATGSATIEATKAIEGAAWPAGKTLKLRLAGTDSAPMPKTETELEITKAGKATFGEITYTEADAGKEYTYTISEDGFGTGWTGSGDVTATVKVTDNGNGTLKTEVTYSPEDATITNTYEASGTAVLEATKAIEGAEWPEGKTITFTLAGEGGTLPETKTVTLNEAGKATFGAITYDQTDAGKEYTYTISEDGFGDGWTGSGDVTAKVEVTDNGDGTLATKVTYSPEDATITNTYKAAGEVILEATKAIEGAAWPEGKTITFTLAGEGGTLPETKTVTLTKAGTATFGAITYDESDVGKEYTYTISEDGFGTGWTGSGDITAKVEVTDNGDGTLATKVTYSPEDATITNTYKATGSATIEATKAIEGAEWPEGKTITFTLAGEGGTLPETKTVTLTKAGTATFGAITYDESDAGKEYTYTISEDGFGDGWTGSDAITATVAVTDNGDGTLKTDVTYTNNGTITNTYEAEGTAVLEATKALKGAEWPEGKTITFTLAGEGGTLPETKTVTLTDAGKATFGAIIYNESDAGKTYTYTISEDGFGKGWTGSGDITAKVEVTDNGDGTLATKVTYSPEDATITNTYKATGSNALKVTKELVGAAWPAGKTLTLTLSGEGGTLPENKTVKLTKAGEAIFDPISYTEADAGKEYTYTITEDGFGKGWTGSGEVTATVKVIDNGDGTLATETTYSPENATITNTYEASGSITLQAQKKLENRDFEEGESYEFELLDESGKLLGTASASNAEPVSFDAISFTEKDLGEDGTATFNYTIKEIEPEQKGEPYCYVTYDTKEVKAVVNLKDNGDGTIDASATYDGSANVPTFTNVYEDTTYTVTKVWDDADNRLQIRPDDLTVTVYAMISGDMLFSREVVLNDSNDWTMKLENLPAKWNGIEIEYIAEEAEVTGYSNATASDAKRMEFVNTTDTGDLSIKKFVNKATEEFDKNDTTDYDFTVTVETEDTETFDQNVTFYTAKANSSDGETTGEITFRNGQAKFTLHSDEIVRIVGLPAGATYKVEESVDASRNYDPVFFNNEGTIIKGKVQYVTFINRELDERTLKVQKSWENDSDFAEYRPEKITVDIYKIQGDEEKLYAKGVDLLKTNGYAEVFNLDGYDAVATVSDATRSSANTSASTANAKKASASTASSSSASFSDAAVADAFDEDGNLKDGTIFDDLFTVVKDVVKEAAGKIGTLFGIDDDTEISFRVEETKVPDHYKVAYDEYDTENHILTFTNTREDANKVWIDPPVKKIISVIRGTITRDETFTFRMTQLNGTTMFPEGAKVKTDDDGYPYMELKITGEGEKEFGKIYYDKVGTYVYEITEVNTGASNYSYSTDSYLVTAEVTADRDKLVENVTVVKNGTDEVFTIKTSDGVGGDVLGIEFVNTYNAGNRGGGGNSGGGGGRRGHTPSTPVEPGSPVLPEVPVPGALPKTGESSGKAVPMLFAMLAMFGALFGFKKRDDEDEQ